MFHWAEQVIEAEAENIVEWCLDQTALTGQRHAAFPYSAIRRVPVAPVEAPVVEDVQPVVETGADDPGNSDPTE